MTLSDKSYYRRLCRNILADRFGENTAHRAFILAGKYVLHRFIVPMDKSATPSIFPILMHRKWSMIGK